MIIKGGKELVINNRTNRNSINSLILGILSILVPFIGLLLGILGIAISRKAKKEVTMTNESGIGIVTAGFIVSVVGISIQLCVIVSLILFTNYMT